MPVALELRGVTKRFVAGARGCAASADALRGVDLSVLEADSVAIVGGPGAGKSTLLFLAAGLLAPDAGVVRWFGDERRSVAVVRAAYHFTGSRPAARLRRSRAGIPHIHLIDAPELLPPETISRLIAWVDRRRRCRDAVVIATRDFALAHALADRVVILQAGRVHTSTQPMRAARRVAERPASVAPRGGTM